MITNGQIEVLCKLAGLEPFMKDNKILWVTEKDFNQNVIYGYEKFKQDMGLNDIRLHWLTTKNAFISGGAAMNWVLGENTNEDIDFFFPNKESQENFELIIRNYFSLCRETSCAKTYMNIEDSLIIQLVGATYSPLHFFGTPQEIISRFDIDVCKFAVDNDTIYTTGKSIKDLIAKSLHYNPDKQIEYINQSSAQRLFKYSRKGFYSSNENSGRLDD